VAAELEYTRGPKLMKFIQILLENRRLFVILGEKRRCWRQQKHGLPQESVLAHLLFNIYTNDQPVSPGTRSFLYAADVCVATQKKSFKEVNSSLGDALDNLIPYYTPQTKPRQDTTLCFPPQKQGSKSSITCQ